MPLAFENSSVVLLAGISDNLPPVLFLVLLGVCALLIVVGAVVDMLPEKEARGATGDDYSKDRSALSTAEKKKAKAETQARKKEEQARKKAEKAAAKAAKGKKGKEKESTPAAPVVSTEPEQGESLGAPIDFSISEEEP